MSVIEAVGPGALVEAVAPLSVPEASAVSVMIFDRDGILRRDAIHPAIIIHPESFLVDDIELPMAARVKRWLQEQGDLSALGIQFPKFTDGRGFSVAARLREAGYEGELHAMGAISQDLVFQLRRVGFTHFHLESPGVEQIERQVLEPFSGYYQAGADGSRAFWQAR